MHINPDWLNMEFLKRNKRNLLKEAITLNEIKIDKGKLAEIDPKIACGHQDEGYCYNNHLMELAHTISDAIDGQLRHLLIDTLNMKCYYYDIDERKLEMLIEDVDKIYMKGYMDGVETMTNEIEGEKRKIDDK